MKKSYLTAAAAIMVSSLLPLNVFADAEITAGADADNSGIRYDITSTKVEDVLTVFNIKADNQTLSVNLAKEFQQPAFNWSGYSQFKAGIVVSNVVGENGANAGNTDFSVAAEGSENAATYNLYSDYATQKSTTDLQTDKLAKTVCEEVGVIANFNEDGIFSYNSDNPMYNVSYENGVLSVKDAVTGETAKDVNITVNGTVVSDKAKVVTGDSVNVMFGWDDAENKIDTDNILTTASARVDTAAAIMNAKVQSHPEYGIAGIQMHDEGDVVNGITVPDNYGRFATFVLPENPKDYLIKSFANSGVIELFQAMFGDVVRADITELVIDSKDATVTPGKVTKKIDNMNQMSAMEIKAAVAENLISLLIPDDIKPIDATMDMLNMKAATATVHYAGGNTETYTVVFLPYQFLEQGETVVNVNE